MAESCAAGLPKRSYTRSAALPIKAARRIEVARQVQRDQGRGVAFGQMLGEINGMAVDEIDRKFRQGLRDGAAMAFA